MREAGAFSDRIDNGDGTWSLPTPEGFDPSETIDEAVVSWRYVGQVRYPDDPQPWQSSITFVEQASYDRSWLENIQRFRRYDVYGREWEVATADRSALEATVGHAVPETTRVSSNEFGGGAEISWEPMSWTDSDCDGSGANELHLWEGEDRDLVACRFLCAGESSTNPMNPVGRQRAAVRVQNSSTNFPASCSGTLFRNLWVLTAAHCVSNDNNTPVPVGNIEVCRFDSNEACQPAVTVSIINPSSYNGGSGNGGGTDFDDDLAIIELGTAWTSLGASAPETMNLSTQSNTELAALTKVHSLGFPSNAPNCTDTSLNRLFHVLEDEPLAAVGGDYVRLKIDGAPGQSGSPFYSCPAGGDEFCASGDPGEIFGVFAGWNSLYSRFVGPKIPGDNRTAILAIAP